MNKGIVMDITESNIIVMRPDGKFDRVARKNRTCEIGEEIVYADAGFHWRSPSVAGKSALAAAVVFCIVLFASFSGKLGSPEVVAYVSMDINPSVEMGIDTKENVLELRGLNDDGVQLIEALDYKNKPIDQVTSKLLDKAEQKALAKGEGEIVIASTVVNENSKVNDVQLAEKLKQQVTKHIQETHPNQASAYQVAAFAAPQEVRTAAAENGLSMGKYTVYLNAKNSGTPLTVDELKKESVLQILKDKPEVAQIMQQDRLPGKAAIKQLVEEEKSGALDKKFEEQQKKNNNGKNGTDNNKTDPKKPGGNNNNGNNNNNSTNKNGNGSNNSNNGNNKNGANNPSNSKNNSSNNNNKNGDNENGSKNNGSGNGNDDKRGSSPSAPVNGKPGSSADTKPGTTAPGASRPGDNQDDRNAGGKKQDDKQDQQQKKDEDKQRSDEQAKDDLKKSTDSKQQDGKKQEDSRKKDEPSKDAKDDGKKDDPKRDDNKSNNDKKGNDNRSNASDDKSKKDD
ncbi:anti-sigma factor domain-containing protein [Paenibacillus filicis]|uniref:Anti-sigma factor domain-containing protein n=1 Tax=Paenibacillus gyeongsangnamensis TaxID=3388067 RepID=A0ABT4Q6Z4_9BACL|nr:anti-sigma factor domain-containing protein [Paenibacillus filicis]MCZ8512643.1 anti-sigma factor domain-containing protein [Paenibacillus filicis]